MSVSMRPICAYHNDLTAGKTACNAIIVQPAEQSLGRGSDEVQVLVVALGRLDQAALWLPTRHVKKSQLGNVLDLHPKHCGDAHPL